MRLYCRSVFKSQMGVKRSCSCFHGNNGALQSRALIEAKTFLENFSNYSINYIPIQEIPLCKKQINKFKSTTISTQCTSPLNSSLTFSHTGTISTSFLLPLWLINMDYRLYSKHDLLVLFTPLPTNTQTSIQYAQVPHFPLKEYVCL